ncbi:hypothetical protein M8J76_000968 [Diaphorina citri]|nr:hypothetical protein M8J75_012732 [Diaphorina citri]KAI5736206.1 hypothetical protein M8J76_000968 [Diaphorina citri]KAI5743436.1 hypothetical protein M8J77_018171 [Diaphorina citri]
MNSEETVKPAGIPGTAQHQEPKTSTNQEILRPIEQPNSSLDSGSQVRFQVYHVKTNKDQMAWKRSKRYDVPVTFPAFLDIKDEVELEPWG